MYPKTHRFITEHALQFRRKNFKGFEKEIVNGCVMEDMPNLSLKKENFQILGLEHFYSPKKGSYFNFLGNAKKKSLFLFNEALNLYKQGNKKQAFRILGRCIHYLQDVASPSHTKLLFHLAEDDFEIYADQNIRKFKFRIRSKMIRPMRPSTCFDKLAKKSYKVNYRKKNKFVTILLHIFSKQPDPEKKLDRLSRKLIKHCIIHTIALMNAFNRRIIRYNIRQKQKRLKQKIIQKKGEIKEKIKAKGKSLVS